MKELGPAAREFVDLHRRDSPLTDATRARIKQKLMLRVSTMGATTAVAGTAAGMSLASKVVLLAVGLTGAVGAGSLSVWALRSRAPAHVTGIESPLRTARDFGAAAPEPAPAAAPMVAPPSPMAPPSRPTPITVHAAAAPTKAPAAGRATPRGAAGPSNAAEARPATTAIVAAAPASFTSVDSGRRDPVKKLNDGPVVTAPETPPPAARRVEAPDPEPELRTLREARDDLRAGRPASAYRRLQDFNRHSPGGMLAQERSALSAIALCQAQPGRDAQERAAEFLRQAPESPLATRVKSACGRAREQSR